MKINKKITTINRTLRTDKVNKYIVIHYVGATSTAANNATYFYSQYRGASANYFVDENEIWQVVNDWDNAWHVGGAKNYYTGARNSNSIGIEMCCKWKNNHWYIEPETIKKTIELTRELKKKYNIPDKNIVRHFDTTLKICPEPLVRDEQAWQDFKNKIKEASMEELTVQEKVKEIQRIATLDDNTGLYLQFYRYNVPLIDKVYLMAKDAEKWRNQAKN